MPVARDVQEILQRYKDLEGLLRASAESFRAYPVKSSSSFKTMV